MTVSSELLAVALRLQQEGSPQEAARICEHVLNSEPTFGPALQLLWQIAEQFAQPVLVIEPLRRAIAADPTNVGYYDGLANSLSALGHHAEAAACYRQQVRLRPNSDVAYYNLGNSLGHQGQLLEAIACYRRTLQLNPAYGAAYNNLGTALRDQGHVDEAITCCHRAAELMPDFAGAHYNLGNALHDAGRFDEAVACFRMALQLQPKLTVAHNNLGNVLRDQGKFAEAIACFRFALELSSDYIEAHNNLGNVLQNFGKIDEALACFRRAIELKPEVAESHYNLGNALLAQGKLGESIASQRRALALKPDFALALNNQGTAFQQLGKLDDALLCYRRAIALKPAFADSYNNLGNALKDQGALQEAADCFRHSLRLRPKADVHSNLLFSLVYDPSLSLEFVLAEHIRWAEQYGQPESTWRWHDSSPDPNRRLRIGYVSGDFRSHAVSCFSEPILSCHNHDRFEVFCYANNTLHDEVTKRFQTYADHWRWITGLGDDAFERTVRADQIDILVDLSGHTAGNRLSVFARKPAPIQATYIGYPTTTGLAAIDYRFTDEILNPMDEPSHHVEELYRLPCGGACFTPREDCPEVTELPALTRGFLTFGAPHNLAKMNRDVFDLWAQLLRTIPTARLSLFRDSLNGHAADQVRTEFVQRGVAAERLEISCQSSTTHGYRGYMEKYGDVDICLDTFPANAGTTGCESLWMGVPWLTLYGTRFFGRQTASLLNRVGMSNWTCHRPDDIVEKAIYWGQHIEQLAEVRRNLRARFRESPLGNPVKFTHALEEVYRDIWRQWCGHRSG